MAILDLVESVVAELRLSGKDSITIDAEDFYRRMKTSRRPLDRETGNLAAEALILSGGIRYATAESFIPATGGMPILVYLIVAKTFDAWRIARQALADHVMRRLSEASGEASKVVDNIIIKHPHERKT